ncbi:peptidylprolyl isomerase [Nemorincola caseinilytica]|uniref:Peptidyl-prolyl cis-trans isomerase n=1 Tax=Nemorincola caseinilytica TaxID=2054315 RepID=A0ABP8NLW7_9BACT
MQQVKAGDKVSVHYHGKLTDGSVFDSSQGREPLNFVAGKGQVIKGFDEAVMNMQPGDKKTVHIPVAEAYGHRNEDMVMDYPVSDFPADMTPQVGMELQMGDDQGNVFPVVITQVNGDMVRLDANHPLAGQDLIFDIELVSID